MDNDFNLVRLVELLQSIDENAEDTKDNEFFIFDKNGNKILL